MGRRSHQPDESLRRQVEALAGYGIPEADIAGLIGIDPKTLRIVLPEGGDDDLEALMKKWRDAHRHKVRDEEPDAAA